MTTDKSRHAPPKAAPMIEALRGLGYSTASALADIIDNSISVHATEIDIIFYWGGQNSTISVLDNGEGMNEQELDLAMRLGEKSPLSKREPHDLGRFGLGLKTASFSQCRRLTVASRKNNILNCLRWDLDIIERSIDDGWYLLEGPADGSEYLLQPLETNLSGTLVLWENLDRIITPGLSEQDFLNLIDIVENHLAMVFHRYLEGPNPSFSLSINGKKVKPWDPFLESNPSTWSSPIEQISGTWGTVELQGHVLPHKDRLDQRQYEIAAGPNGWISQQGYYIYRNKRLLVPGSWLGLGRGKAWIKEEGFRLARIRLDIPNTSDSEWKIDVRKSTARPPVSIRERLKRFAEDTRDRARKVFAHRGQMVPPGKKESISQAWRAENFKGGMRYRISKDHPAIKAVLDDSGLLKPQIEAMLRIIEETIPVQRIWLDTAEAKETPRTHFAEAPKDEIHKFLFVIYKNMVLKKCMNPSIARDKLLKTEPFNNYPDLIRSLPDDLVAEEP